MNNSLIYNLERLLKKNTISFNRDELKFQIQSHPSYPSLHAVTGVLDHFNIENIAATVSIAPTVLKELPKYFIAQVAMESFKDLVFVEKSGANYVLQYSQTRKDKLSETEFLKIFTGIILVTEKKEVYSSNSGDNGFFKRNAFYAVLILCYTLFISFELTLMVNLYLILSFFGTIVSIAILKQDFGLNSSIGNAFCSSTNENKDCNRVLSSKGATMFNKFKLSDISLTFFSGQLLSILLISYSGGNIESLYYISFLGIPVVLYSLFYQYKIVRKWCFLCLTIALILSLQASFVFSSGEWNIHSLSNNFLIIVLSYLLAFFVFQFIKDNYTKTLEATKTKLDYHIFKRNFKIFSKLLNSGPKMVTKLENIPEIVFGNEESNLEIVIITNPFCGHCIPVHKIVEDLLLRYGKEVKIIIRFNVRSEETDTNATKVSGRLLELYNSGGKSDCLWAMTEIYEGKSVNDWLKKWGESKNMEKYVSVLKLEREWCLLNGINFTPEILINGRSFPREYKREDITYFIEDLYEGTTGIPAYT